MIQVARFHHIKLLAQRENLSQREIARKLGISRNTVSKYLRTNTPPTAAHRRKVYGRPRYSEETLRVIPLIDQWLQDDLQIWKKQRHTASRIYRRLRDEYGFIGSESNIRKVVAARRAVQKEVFIPLTFALGQQFQFDWGEADVKIHGETTRVFLFCMELSASRKRFVWAYRNEQQESFLDGFVRAFEYFGGVPAIGLFDNLKSAVKKILTGRNRQEQETFIALQAHYVFEAEFANARRGNEKGIVEGLVGYVRRSTLAPVPDVGSLEELNSRILLPWCERVAETEHVPHSKETAAQVYERERVVLHPLPMQPYEACRIQPGTVSKTSTVTFDTDQYSVPSRYAGQAVWVKGFVDQVIIVAQNEVIASHERSLSRQQMVLELDHYLEVLLKKPRAVRDARVMHDDKVPEVFRRVHAKMRERQDAEGDRLFVRFLLLHREVGMERLRQALEEAERTSTYHFEGLQEILAQLTEPRPHAPLAADQVPVDLNAYRVQRSNLQMYNRLSGGGELQ